MNAPAAHPDDVFHVIIDACAALIRSHESGDGVEFAWARAAYDEGVTPMGDEQGYLDTLRNAVTLASTALNGGKSRQVYEALGVEPPDQHVTYPTVEVSEDAQQSYDPLLMLLNAWVQEGVCVDLHLHGHAEPTTCQFLSWEGPQAVRVRLWHDADEDYTGAEKVVSLGTIDKIVYR